MRLRLFPKIALILIALSTIPAAIVGWQTAAVNREHLETDVLELHTNLAQSLSKRLDLYLVGLAQKISATVRSARAQGAVSSAQLQPLIDSNSELISIAYVRPDGRELIKAVQPSFPAEATLSNRSQDEVFKQFLSRNAGTEKAEPSYGFYFQDGEPRLTLVFPFDEADVSRGAFYLRASLSRLWGEIAAEGAGVQSGGREVIIVDEKGVVIVHSKGASVKSQESMADHPIVAEAIQGRSVGSKEFQDRSGRRMIGAYARVQSTGWTAIIQQTERSAFSAIYEARRRTVQIVFFSLLGSGLIAFFFAKNISKPILALIEGARRVAQRDFQGSVSVQTDDEISDLAGTFNDMIRELQHYDDLQVDRIIEEKTKTDSVIHSIADGILLLDRDGMVRLSNASVGLILQSVSENEAAGSDWSGKNVFDRLVPDWSAALKDLVDRAGQSPVREMSVSRNAQQLHYRLASRRVHTLSGKDLGVLLVLQDVTLERELDQLKDTFLHSITHDLRNPMTSILGFIKFLGEGAAGPVTDTQKDIFSTMRKAGVQLLDMINDILDIAKMEAGKMTTRLDDVDLKEVLQEVSALFRPLAGNKRIRLELAVLDSATVLKADRGHLERVVANLVGNAVKYASPDSAVRLELREDPARVHISVSDEGPGIPPDELERIFDRFHQVQGQGNRGTGLGLTICKYFVELHRGEIRVESALGKGTRFDFWIPKGLTRSPDGSLMVGGPAL